MNNDTIIALATPKGESAIAMLRLSGNQCISVAQAVFCRTTPLPPRRAQLATYRTHTGEMLDQVLYTYFAEGASYSGESMLEIACHGNPLIVQRILEDCLTRGCRMAEPGEFTRRAFMAGKMDLTQAEAVAEVIAARSERALAAAQKRLDGALGQRIHEFCDQILRILAELEAYIDFPEEDIPDETSEGPLRALTRLIRDLRALESTGRYHDLLNEGVKTIIVGPPNAGKSSLLNALFGDDRVLVSEEAGTTRDFITERIFLGNTCIHLMDTAGLREAENPIERAGVAKTLEKMRQADFFLYVIDASAPTPTLPAGSLELFHVEQTLVVENKCDLPTARTHPDLLPDCPRVRISAKNNEGLDALKNIWRTTLEKGLRLPSADDLLVSARHASALRVAADALEAALDKLRDSEHTELVCVHLREALDALGEITGRIDNERMLDQLFSNFCIGK